MKNIVALCAGSLIAFSVPTVVFAQVEAAPKAAPATTVLKIPEGTELQIRIDEKLSSASAQEDDKFSISLAEDATIDGVTIPKGFRGRGTVQSAKKRKMMGQAGQLNIALDYIKIGDVKVHVRANKGKEGEGHMGATVALTILFGPLGLLKHGDDVVVNEGTIITGYVADDAEIPLPVATVPPSAD